MCNEATDVAIENITSGGGPFDVGLVITGVKPRGRPVQRTPRSE